MPTCLFFPSLALPYLPPRLSYTLPPSSSYSVRLSDFCLASLFFRPNNTSLFYLSASAISIRGVFPCSLNIQHVQFFFCFMATSLENNTFPEKNPSAPVFLREYMRKRLVIFTFKAAAAASRRTKKKNSNPRQPQEEGPRDRDSFPDCNKFFFWRKTARTINCSFFSRERPPVALGILWSWAVGGVEIEVHGKRRGGWRVAAFRAPPPPLSPA